MFSRGSKSDQTEASVVRQASRSSGGPAKGRPSGVTSMIGVGLVIEGSLESSGEICIQGAVKGDIAAVSVIVSESGRVEGAITADVVRIGGTVQGKVRGSAIAIAKSARVVGDVYHGKLSIEEGAVFEGSVRYVEPQAAGHAMAGPAAGAGKDSATPVPATQAAGGATTSTA